MASRLSCRVGIDNLPPQIPEKWNLGCVAVPWFIPVPKVPGAVSASCQPSSELSCRLCWLISGGVRGEVTSLTFSLGFGDVLYKLHNQANEDTALQFVPASLLLVCFPFSSFLCSLCPQSRRGRLISLEAALWMCPRVAFWGQAAAKFPLVLKLGRMGSWAPTQAEHQLCIKTAIRRDFI